MANVYKCPQCGNAFTSQQEVSRVHCPYCGNEYDTAGNQQPPQFNQGNTQQQYGYQQPYRSNDVFAEGPSGKSRGIAALLAIFLGAFGIHYFYLGKTTPGVVFLVATLISCFILSAVTGIVALIQGILMLCMSQQDFENKYVNPAVSFPLF